MFFLVGLGGCLGGEKPLRPDAATVVRPDPCLELARRFAPSAGPVRSATTARSALAEAQALADKGDWREAESRFLQALTEDPSLGLAHLGLAESLGYLGEDPERRRRHLGAAVLDLPNNPRAQEGFAFALEAAGDRAGALRQLRCALARKPTATDARHHAARLALSLEGPDEAQALLDPLLDAPGPQHLLLAAEIRIAKQDASGAADAVERAARLAKSAPLFRRAAEAWARADAPDRERAAREEAERLDPAPTRDLRPLPDARVPRRPRSSGRGSAGRPTSGRGSRDDRRRGQRRRRRSSGDRARPGPPH